MNFRSIKQRQEDQIANEQRAPVHLTREEWVIGQRAGTLAVGSVWYGCVGAYGPKGSAAKKRRDLE